MTETDKVEFSLIVDLKDPDSLNKSFSFKASKEECAALAKRFGIPSLDRFEGEYQIRGPRHNGQYVLTGSVDADVTQTCVVSMKPVKDQVAEDFEVHLVGEHDMPGDDEELDIDFEPIMDGKVNVGEVASQYLSLGINPYPRASDVKLDLSGVKNADVSGEEEEKERRNPFGVLKDITD